MRSERTRRRPLDSVLLLAAWYVAFFVGIGLCASLVDMDGHDPHEEPIRDSAYRTIRFLWTAVYHQFMDPFHRQFGALLGGVLVWTVFLAGAVCFGIAATAILGSWRVVIIRIRTRISAA